MVITLPPNANGLIVLVMLLPDNEMLTCHDKGRVEVLAIVECKCLAADVRVAISKQRRMYSFVTDDTVMDNHGKPFTKCLIDAQELRQSNGDWTASLPKLWLTRESWRAFTVHDRSYLNRLWFVVGNPS
jgi:hypothetical protein